jgi:GNAT superfamily N-acetyltransferase
VDGGASVPGRPNVEVREASPDEFLDAIRLFEGALLAVDAGAVRDAASDDGRATLLVAADGGSVVGALYAEPSAPDAEPPPPGVPAEATHVVAVAVRRRRRGEGVGRALVLSASDRADALTAAFDPDVRPFYGALGFEIGVGGDDGEGENESGENESEAEGEGQATRLWGVLRDRPPEP